MSEGGVGLHLRDTGNGAAMLLLHAFPQDGTMWDQQVAALSGEWRCLRPDAPGCGASPAPSTRVPIDAWAALVAERVSDAGVERCVVVGSSMGGYLALALLRVAPALVAGLALVGTRATADTAAVRRERLRRVEQVDAGEGRALIDELAASMPDQLLSAQAAAEAHVVEPVRGRIRRCTAEGLGFCQAAMAGRPDSTAQLSEIAVPSLVVAGEVDAIVPVDEMRDLAAAIPGARIEVITGAGHLLALERPQALSALLAELGERAAQNM